jgi:hypothetical protein
VALFLDPAAQRLESEQGEYDQDEDEPIRSCWLFDPSTGGATAQEARAANFGTSCESL